jgi:hypothetical protein
MYLSRLVPSTLPGACMSPIRWTIIACVALLLAPAAGEAQSPRFTLEIEGGPAWQSRNDVEIPNDGSATRFALDDLVRAGAIPAGRVYLGWAWRERHGVRLLVAPLTLREEGVPDTDIRFAGSTFQGGEPVSARYTFNSYRLSYRWLAREGDRTTAWLGATAKLRDAVVTLEQAGVSARDDDLGFVPLLHLAGEWRFAPGWHAGLDMDALAGGPGRAIDAALRIGREVNDGWRVSAGYRTVEGGADIDAVYAFAWFNYLTVGLSRSW